ncbi:hypothetical protein ABPG77_006536 [Micractinium sp. CCAP 211/92]
MSSAGAAPVGSPSMSADVAVAAGSDAPDADLPKALMKRILKARLAQWDAANGGDGTRDFQINKDALLACSEAAKLFIHYLAATANDACRDAKRQTVSADDVLTALEDLEFGELVEPLKAALEAYRLEAKEKTKKRSEQQTGKKRKGGAGGGGDGAAVGAAGEQQAAEGGGAAPMDADAS